MAGKKTAAGEKTPRAEITRVDEEGFHGWVVTVWKKGMEHQRRFAESESRGPSAALTAAVRFRNRVVSGTGAVGPAKQATGIRGISVGRVITSAGRSVKNYKVSLYRADGKRFVRVFSWLKYGKREALRLAKQALKAGRAEARQARALKKKGKSPGEKIRIRKSVLARSKPTEFENVRRVDHNHFHGYVVALVRVRSRHSKYFCDRTCGGRGAALARAREYRDALLADLPPPVRIHRRTGNPTGIPGVALVYDRTRSGRIVPRFVSYWPTAEGGRKKKSFSTVEHGFEGAERKAIQARNEGVGELLLDRKAMLLDEIEKRKRQREKSGGRLPNPPPLL